MADSKTTHGAEAAGTAMTLDELAAYVAELRALRAPGDTRIEARGGWSGSRKLLAKWEPNGG